MKFCMKINKAILTGGGRATRLYPVTASMNKHLLPLANKPMIFHAIETVAEAGIREIFINTNPGDTELAKQVGDGGRWGVSISYFEQRGGPRGIAHVVSEARRFIGDDPFLFYLSDNIILGGIRDFCEAFSAGEYDCMLAFSQVPDPERFGVPVFSPDGRLTDVLEKPASPPTPFAVTGMYLYGPKIFFEAFPKIQPSPRGEYEISSVNSELLRAGKRVGYREVTGWWKDTGKPDDLLEANRLLLSRLGKEFFTRDGLVAGGAEVRGAVRIGAGSRVDDQSVIIGPAMIGENCLIERAKIGPNVCLGAGCVIRGATVENSLLLDHAALEVRIFLRDSIIGKSARVRGFQTEGVWHRLILGEKTVVEAL